MCKNLLICLIAAVFLFLGRNSFGEEFSWWPTDAKPAPVEDREKGGYWWWPQEKGSDVPLWGNRGYCYVRKVIFDYKAEELPPPKNEEMRPSLVIKKIIKNVKVYFDYNKTDLRDDAVVILRGAVQSLNRNPDADILITGNCDRRGSETYNEKLGQQRAQSVRKLMLDEGIEDKRIRIISRGKLDAVAPVGDIVGMQKDRNAQFMVAEVEEVMIPAPASGPQVQTDPSVQAAAPIEENQENLESEVKVSTREYVVKKGDSLWKIAEKELGSGHRWKYLYEFNKDKIKNSNKLRAGVKILIPVE